MSDEWKKREQALEEGYFQRVEADALERLAKKSAQPERLSPITGKPMVQKTLHGVVIDQCTDSQGIWLDAGELEQIAQYLEDAAKVAQNSDSLVHKFFSAVLGSK